MDRGLGAGVGTLQGLRGLVVTKSAGREGQTRSVGAQTVSFSSCQRNRQPSKSLQEPATKSPAHDHAPAVQYKTKKRKKGDADASLRWWWNVERFGGRFWVNGEESG